MTDIYEALNSADVRIEKLFWLPGASACGTPPEDFREFCEDEIEDREVREINLPALTAAHSEADGDADVFVEYLIENLTSHRVSGFIVQIATPVTRDHRKGSYAYSWGHYTTTWRYVKTVEEIVPLATAWAHERREADRNREAAKAATPTPGTAGEGGDRG